MSTSGLEIANRADFPSGGRRAAPILRSPAMKTTARRRTRKAGLAFMLLSLATVGAQPVTINFESFTGMTFNSGTPVPA